MTLDRGNMVYVPVVKKSDNSVKNFIDQGDTLSNNAVKPFSEEDYFLGTKAYTEIEQLRPDSVDLPAALRWNQTTENIEWYTVESSE